MTLLVLRMFCETSDKGKAGSVAERARDLLKEAGYEVAGTKVRPYWKMPECYEIVLEAPAAPRSGTLNVAMARLGSGWGQMHEREALWNREQGSRFFEKKIRWAHLELIE